MNTPISFDNLKSICPSVFATKPSDKVSDKYSFVPTIEVIENFQKEGWNVFSAQQRGSSSHGRHMVRLRNGDLPQVGDSLIEAIITNSHDGTAKLNISSGLFRLDWLSHREYLNQSKYYTRTLSSKTLKRLVNKFLRPYHSSKVQ